MTRQPRSRLTWTVSIVSAVLVVGLVSWIVASSYNLSTPSPAKTTTSLPKLPVRTLAGDLGNDTTMVPLTKGSGSTKLRQYTPHGAYLYIQFACTGKGTFEITGYFEISHCGTTSAVASYPNQANIRVSPEIIAPTGMKWEIVITSGPKQSSPG